MTKLDIDLIKRHIHALGAYLVRRARGQEVQSLLDLHPDVFDPLRNRYSREVFPRLVQARYTRLCALRAEQRGRLHFSPRTNLAEAHWLLGVPCKGRMDSTLPGGWHYLPITREVQRTWLAGLASEYMKKTTDERLPAR